jgi:hypothetical protein
MNVALITVIEADKQNVDSNNTQLVRLFEQEAIRAFTAWRKNAGALSAIDIYAVCITKNTIADSTKQKFADLHVTYLEAYHPETETFTCGFYNKPLGCKYLEQILPHDYLIHIDLDMYVMRPPTLEWRNSCMIYDDIQRSVERIHIDGAVYTTYNTCLMVTNRQDNIFASWWDTLKRIDTEYAANPAYYHTQYPNLEYRKLEELAFDILSTTVPIHNIPNSIFGETYTALADMTVDELAHVCFHHYHIYPQLSRYNWIQDMKEWNKHLQ